MGRGLQCETEYISRLTFCALSQRRRRTSTNTPIDSKQSTHHKLFSYVLTMAFNCKLRLERQTYFGSNEKDDCQNNSVHLLQK